MAYNRLGIIQDFLFPPTCVICGNRGFQGRDLCPDCHRRLPVNRPCCSRCGNPLAEAVGFALCGRCLSKPPPFDRVWAPYRYDGAVRHVIGALKFEGRYAYARLLGDLLADFVHCHAELPGAILPVPLHPVRYRQRGFNQSVEIARHVAKALRVPLDLAGCVRRRDTPPQHRLSARERLKNVRAAFALSRPPAASHIAIVDDVMTTGSTVRALAKLLKKAGAEKVDVWVCARA